MSGGRACCCDETLKPIEKREWFVLQRQCNHSAFNGYQYTRSDYSSIHCKRCGSCWRTKAGYVYQLKDD